MMIIHFFINVKLTFLRSLLVVFTLSAPFEGLLQLWQPSLYRLLQNTKKQKGVEPELCEKELTLD